MYVSQFLAWHPRVKSQGGEYLAGMAKLTLEHSHRLVRDFHPKEQCTPSLVLVGQKPFMVLDKSSSSLHLQRPCASGNLYSPFLGALQYINPLHKPSKWVQWDFGTHRSSICKYQRLLGSTFLFVEKERKVAKIMFPTFCVVFVSLEWCILGRC